MKTIKKHSYKWLAIVICLLATVDLFAQENPDKDPMQDFFFPPELVMRYQNEIQLKKEQKELIIGVVEEAQKKFNRLQWDLQNEMTTFQKLLTESIVNESKALEQLDKVLDQERMIKKAQITLMIRIKNALTDDQKVKLNAMKGK
jgi:Spy/CpxP family protein refolding chaperone